MYCYRSRWLRSDSAATVGLCPHICTQSVVGALDVSFCKTGAGDPDTTAIVCGVQTNSTSQLDHHNTSSSD
jgi:hypothetical protein